MDRYRTYEVGSVARCRFVFGNRALTDGELGALIDDGTLPEDLETSEPANVYFDYQAGDAARVTLSDTDVTTVTTGDQTYYEVQLPVTAKAKWWWRGRGTDSDDAPVCATFDQFFMGEQDF